MRNRKKVVLITIAASLVCAVVLLALLNISDTGNKTKGNMIVRKATPEEIGNAKTAKYVDGITTKFGDFEYTPDAPVPSEGVVYNLGDIRKDTKMVIIGEKKFLKVEE
ncbi:MAG: hypothetical protein E7L01_00540 [Paenibacillus macerans]|uniref:Uncharacterized protein n=1 Tax=Paenibacillus macerans TaxID=44252 RepID=A0A6N8EM77_PAEMA|nr:hypothetical protein [Paenibacillus macerans]MBS5909576.1 hypothetical protein [Paenibacillus macerans]MDU5947164.1 hypothetical protein [Paenibacillus macerans]MDU7471835.1 hypothetical protein [Paenibacillus macerans]MEC0136412.1 hypothetical protein [Paenibacillus macerans]MEC0329882.1 hypothetical protein [Paenibacillus macerans]